MEEIKVFTTRHALTLGIEEVEGKICTDSMFCEKGPFGRYFYVEGRDWHRTKESAIAKAEEMRMKKIKSLKKQIEKLEKIKF